MTNLSTIQLIGSGTGTTVGQSLGFLDLDDSTILPLTFALGDIRDISSRTGSFSKSIKIKGTKNNNKLLNHYYNINVSAGTFDINKKQSCLIYQNGVVVFDNAIMQLISVSKIETGNNYDEQIEYTVLIKDTTSDFFTIINNKYLEDLNLQIAPQVYNAQNVVAAFSNDFSDGYKYILPYAETTDSEDELLNDNIYNLTEFKPAVFVRRYFDRIFAEAATGTTGSFRYNFPSMNDSSIRFDNLLIPFNGDDSVTSEDDITNYSSEFSGSTTQTSTNNYNQYGTNYFIKEIAYHKLLMPVEVNDPNGYYDPSTSIYTTPNITTGKRTSKFEYEITYRIYSDNTTGDDCTLDTQGYSMKIKPLLLIQGIEAKQPPLMETPITIQNGATFNVGQNTLYATTITGTQTIDNFKPNTKIEFGFKANIWQQTGSGDDTNRLRFLDSRAGITQGCKLKMEVTSIKIKVVSSIQQDYDKVNLNKFIPKKVKQSDFLKAIFNMFNLYCEVDKNDPLLINIERRDTYYDNGVVVNWENKLVKDDVKDLTFLPLLTNKKLILTYKQDSDAPNKLFEENVNEIYGQQEFIFTNEYVKDIDKKEILFSPTPVTNLPFGAVVPMINGASPSTNIRILIDGGQYSCQSYSIKDYDSQPSNTVVASTTYSHISHWDKPTNPTFDLNFGVCDFYYRTDSYGEATNNTLFNMHWRRTVNQINKGKMLSAYFNLNEVDIANMRLSDKILVHNAYWNINKIIDFDANANKPTKVELISVDDELIPFPTKVKKTITISAPIWWSAVSWLNTRRLPWINTIQTPNVFVRGFGNWISPGASTTASVIGNNNWLNNGQGIIRGNNNFLLGNGGVVFGSNNVVENNSSFVTGSNNYVPEWISDAIILGNNMTADTNNAVYVPNLVLPSGGTINGVPIENMTGGTGGDVNFGYYKVSERTWDGIANLLNIKNTKPGNPYSILEIWSNDENPLESTMALFLQPTGSSSSYMFTDFSCMNYDNDQRAAIVMQSRNMSLYPLRISYDDGTGAYNQYQFNPDGAFKLLKNPINNNHQRMELGNYGSVQDYIRYNDTGFASSRATSIQFNNYVKDMTAMDSQAYNMYAAALRLELNGDGQFLFRYAPTNRFDEMTIAPGAWENIGLIDPLGVRANGFYREGSDQTHILMGDGSINHKIFYNVMDYGCFGDGVTDDTAAFNNCIAVANANSGIVFIPNNINVCVFSSIYLPDNTTIQGANKYTSIVSLSPGGSTTANVIQNQTFVGGNKNISLSNFTIDGANLANTTCIQFQKCSGLTISQMVITRGGIEGIYLYLSKDVIVNDLVTHHNGGYQVDASGIHFDTCDGFQLNGCVSYNNGFHGVITSTSTNGYIQATCHNNGFNGVLCQTNSSDIVIDCNSYSNFRGVYLTDSTRIRVTGTIKGNSNGLLTRDSTACVASCIFNSNGADVYLVGGSDELNLVDGFPINPIVIKDYTTSLLLYNNINRNSKTLNATPSTIISLPLIGRKSFDFNIRVESGTNVTSGVYHVATNNTTVIINPINALSIGSALGLVMGGSISAGSLVITGTTTSTTTMTCTINGF